MFRETSKRFLGVKDFDAWAYSTDWPRQGVSLPFLRHIHLAVEDFKFAYNAWSLLRLAMFYGLPHPKILSNMTNTVPNMGIDHGGNRLFYLNTRVGQPLSGRALRVALTPDHPNAVPLQAFPWRTHFQSLDRGGNFDSIEIVLGMENGLSEAVRQQCDHCVYIAQYGSIGSLSMTSALAIATHTAVNAATQATTPLTDVTVEGQRAHGNVALPTLGHMPLSNHAVAPVNPRPHETDLLHFSNDDIIELLKQRRKEYSLQIGVLFYNNFGDRNIGAIMRNANAFNCEEMIIVNRRRFNRRGAVGTNHLLKTTFVSSTADARFISSITDYEVWQMHQYYPFLELYDGSRSMKTASHRSEESTFIRHEDSRLQQYLSDSKFSNSAPIMLRKPTLSLDDEAGLLEALRQVRQRGKKGVMLAVPEEGSVMHPDVSAVCTRVLFVVHPSRLAAGVQRGLNAALSTAVAMERIRTCIDNI